MSTDTDMATRPNGLGDNPSTPPNDQSFKSQQSLPSTEGPASPVDPASSFKTEVNDDRIPSSQVIPSSLTPPPSSQPPPQTTNGASYISAQRANMFSPPATTRYALRHDESQADEYAPPNSQQIEDASVEELRNMFKECLAENTRLKMETAHHRLQYNLLSMQANEDAKRAEVEHEMTRREIDVLRMAEHSRQAKRELSAAQESTQTKYLQLQAHNEAILGDNGVLCKRLKLAKKVIQQKEDDVISLTDERDLLLNRIRENREHFRELCSPGGAFHGALTPKTQAVATPQQYPQQYRATPRQHPRSVRQESNAGFDALLQALSHGDNNNSAPSTPTAANRPAPRVPSKHARGVQSLSSLPTTPNAHPRGEHSTLLPAVDLVPQTDPQVRFGPSNGGRYVPETPKVKRSGRKSRESTISAEDEDELARDPNELARVAAATQSFMSHASPTRSGRHDEEEPEVFESQASQAASEMLRRDPRKSFEGEVAISRDGTPAPDKRKPQAKLFANVNKAGLEKRKYSGPAVPEVDGSRRDVFTSPAKKMRYGTATGLGIQYGQEA